ncbi:subtilisin family serine protease [Anaerotaenia torta]|uniref:S8 family peptidase n=1 Tax=Anaerotaenia torta TaxID=433293 RepID=UPI003D242E88
MIGEERYRITSEDYMEVIIELNENPRLLEQFPDVVVQSMNDWFAIAYLPASQLLLWTISQYDYSSIPSAFGLTSEISLEASGILRLRRIPVFNLRGEGVLVGIIDTGIDYTNPVFRRSNGTTKIAALWDQTVESDRYPAGAQYGTEYLSDDINVALSSQDPLSIVPSTDENGHGTMLAGIAAGTEDEANGFSGVVPDSELVVVKLKPMKQVLREFYIIPPGVPAYQENDIMWGVQYVIDMARRLQKPVAICLALGTSQGAHDGFGGLGTLLYLTGDFPGVAISVSAGNEGTTRRHFFAQVDANTGYSTVEMNVAEDEEGFVMELWGRAPNTYSVDILSPGGEYIPRIPEGLYVNREIRFVFERTRIFISYQMIETRTGDQVIMLRFVEPTPGIWRFQVYTRGDLEGSFHIWLPMNGFISENTYFVQPDPYTTIVSPGNTSIPITVTAYNPVNNNLYQRASRGYTRGGAVKPELAAPGVNILAPSLEQGFTSMSGTGAAAAHAAGVAAILLEWGNVRNNYPGINSVEIKQFLIRGANRSPTLIYPNRDWGYGMIDIYNVFDMLRSDVN